ncbi:hypothetical protein E1301_Tti023159 [Triplophysa tibetana]|uniref:Uncharacterized protein n=1 Tax=Triplophysa tibetana TaxID=1572043 RepID=A0A5A9PKE3_9TELE|nr:hypothetical protein E1301_Tti023159 [Triplophysa tibetana]
MVFNKDILTFHKMVLKKFKQEHGINVPEGYQQREIDALGGNSLPATIEAEIQKNMVAYLGEDELYVNANPVMFDICCKALKHALLVVLRHMNTDDVTEEDRQRLNGIIDYMNYNEIYVDEVAKVSLIANHKITQQRFDDVKQEVVQMLKIDRGEDWCLRILHLVPRLFIHEP